MGDSSSRLADDPRAGAGALRLALAGITKQYPAVRANDNVTLSVAPGEIHALLGENGAGKSTLMKIVYGAVRPDAGEIRWEGEAVEIPSPAAARKLGIGMVFQHFSLFETLTVGENISSIEVEDALYKHPAVMAVAVVAKPDDKWGETPCAFVELKAGAQATSDELLQWCKQNLASYKCPRYLVFADIPKTSTGKIQKFKLREMAKAV